MREKNAENGLLPPFTAERAPPPSITLELKPHPLNRKAFRFWDEKVPLSRNVQNIGWAFDNLWPYVDGAAAKINRDLEAGETKLRIEWETSADGFKLAAIFGWSDIQMAMRYTMRQRFYLEQFAMQVRLSEFPSQYLHSPRRICDPSRQVAQIGHSQQTDPPRA